MPTTGWTPAEFTQFLKEVITPIVTVLGTVLIALIGRGIKRTADKDTPIKEEETHTVDAFKSGTLHYIAMQATQISDLEDALKEALTRNRELTSDITLLKSTFARQQRADDLQQEI